MTPVDRDELLARLSGDVDALMREKGLSIARLARRADVSEVTVQSILKAKAVTIPKLLVVLGALGARLSLVVTTQPDALKKQSH